MSRPWLFVQYIVHSIVASYGLMILGEIIEYLVGLHFGSQNRWLDYYFIGPTFLFPIIAGLVAGFVLGASLPRASSRLLLLLPLAMMVWELWGWIHDPGITVHRLMDNFVGTNCESSECLEEGWLTSPLISAIAYSLGAEVGRFRTRLGVARRSRLV